MDLIRVYLTSKPYLVNLFIVVMTMLKLNLTLFKWYMSQFVKDFKDFRAEIVRKQHSRGTPVSISLGDFVVKRAHDRQWKLTPTFSGPFLLIETFHGNKFRIKDNTLNISEIVHVDRLKWVDVLIPSPHLSYPPLSSPLTSPNNLRSRTTVSAVSSSCSAWREGFCCFVKFLSAWREVFCWLDRELSSGIIKYY